RTTPHRKVAADLDLIDHLRASALREDLLGDAERLCAALVQPHLDPVEELGTPRLCDVEQRHAFAGERRGSVREPNRLPGAVVDRAYVFHVISLVTGSLFMPSQGPKTAE